MFVWIVIFFDRFYELFDSFVVFDDKIISYFIYRINWNFFILYSYESII